MGIHFCYLLIFGAEAWIFYQYALYLFAPARSLRIVRLCVFAAYGALFGIQYFQNMTLNTILFFLANLLLLLFLFSVRPYTALFHSLLLTVVMSMSELFIVSIGSSNFYLELDNLRNLYLMAGFSKLCYFLIAQILSRFFQGSAQKQAKPDYGMTLMILIPLLSFVIHFTLFWICVDNTTTRAQNILISCSSFILLGINFLTFWIYSYSQKQNENYLQLQLRLQNEQNKSHYYQTLAKRENEQSILIHDIKRHLQSICILNEQGNSQKIDEYIKNLVSDYELQTPLRVSDNELLNAIFNHYSALCHNKNITLHVDIRNQCLGQMNMDALTSLVCNLLDNAIEACLQIPNASIEFTICRKPNTPYTMVQTINSCLYNPIDPNTRSLKTKKRKCVPTRLRNAKYKTNCKTI